MIRVGAALMALILALPGPALAQRNEQLSQGPVVTVVPAERRLLVDEVIVSGSLVPRQEVLVAPEIEGLRLTELLVEEGERVTRGQVLARLSAETIKAQLAQIEAAQARLKAAVSQARSRVSAAQAARDEAASALRRTQELVKDGTASRASLDERQAAARTAEAQLAEAREGIAVAEAQIAESAAQRQELLVRLGQTEITAPVDGVVFERSARLGATVSAANGPLFRVIRDGVLELEAQIAEPSLARMAEGQPASVMIAGLDQPRPGKVRLIPPEIDRTTRLGRARIALDDSSGLKVGAFGRASVEVARREGIAVPASSVQFSGDGVHALVVRDGTARVRAVEVGMKAGDAVEVVRGIEPGEKVVAVSGTFLRDGDRVRAVLREEAAR